jgi:ribosomal protein S6--L-glutamate ligase
LRLVTFDPLRTLGCPALALKPAQLLGELELLRAADCLLFPDYADIAFLCHVVRRPIYPSLATYQLGFDKFEMTRAFVAHLPQNVPETLMRGNTELAREEILDRMALPFVAKLPRASRGEGVFLIEDRAQWRSYCARTPLLYVQERLPIDRDLRVVWVGDRIVDAYWRVAAPGVFQANVARGGTIVREDVPAAALGLVTALADALGLDHAGFDIAVVDGHPYVLEFNRLFGLAGLAQAGIRVGELIAAYLARILAVPRATAEDAAPEPA